MKFKNKVLVAALAITMTTGSSLTKDFSNLSIRSNVAYASEDKVGKLIKVDQTEIERETHEYLIDHFKALQEDKEAYEKLDYHEDYTEALVMFEEKVLTKEGVSEDERQKEVDKKVKGDLKSLIYKEESEDTIYNKLKKDKASLEENGSNKTLIENIDKLLKAMDIFYVKGNELILSSESNQAYYTSSVKPYIDEKRADDYNKENLETINTLKKEIKERLDSFEGIENTEFSNIKKEDLSKLKDELEKTKKLLEKEASKEELEAQKTSLETSEKELRDKLDSNFKEFIGKFTVNEKKLSEDAAKPFREYINKVHTDIENLDLAAIDSDLNELEKKSTDLDKAIEGGQQQLDNYKETIKEAEDFKNSPDYYRSSPNKRLAFNEALNELKVYISKVEKKESEFNKENADNLVGKLDIAQTNLNGFKYKKLLEEAKKKLDKNKNKLGDKYDALLKTYNELADKNNKEYTVDRVRAFSDDIDSKLKSATLRPSTNNPSSKPSTSKPKNSGVQVSAKKVAVPRAKNGSGKSAKSLVRTGIDSIKIFGVVAVVAVVLLLLTRNKNKNGKNDNEK